MPASLEFLPCVVMGAAVVPLFERSRRGVSLRVEPFECSGRSRYTAELLRGDEVMVSRNAESAEEAERLLPELLAWFESDDPRPPWRCSLLMGIGQGADGCGLPRMFLIADPPEERLEA